LELLEPADWELNVYVQEHILRVEVQMTYPNLILGDVDRDLPIRRIPPGWFLPFSLQVERWGVPLVKKTRRGYQPEGALLEVTRKWRPGNGVYRLPIHHLIESCDQTRKELETINRQGAPPFSL
jgi:hypothetical protein